MRRRAPMVGKVPRVPSASAFLAAADDGAAAGRHPATAGRREQDVAHGTQQEPLREARWADGAAWWCSAPRCPYARRAEG
eukprot:4689173-Prymnesium_polylepis.1